MCWIALGLIILSWSNHQNYIKQVPSCEENFIIYQLRSGVLCGAVTGSRWTTRMGQRIEKYSSRAAIGSEVLIRILSHLLSNVPCLLPYFWTANLLQDLSSQYRIFWTHPWKLFTFDIGSEMLSNVPCLLLYFWTANLLQDLSSQYRIFWTHPWKLLTFDIGSEMLIRALSPL